MTRREMLGVALTPNIIMGRMDLTARFVATIPLVYLPRRKSWRPEANFKLELLQSLIRVFEIPEDMPVREALYASASARSLTHSVFRMQTYEVCQKFIKPTTSLRQTCLVNLFVDEEGAPIRDDLLGKQNCFISHWWCVREQRFSVTI